MPRCVIVGKFNVRGVSYWGEGIANNGKENGNNHAIWGLHVCTPLHELHKKGGPSKELWVVGAPLEKSLHAS